MSADTRSESSTLSCLSLRILATSDLHASLHPYNYYTDTPQDDVGLARVGGMIQQLRDAADNCVLLDNGDTLQGTPLGDFAATDRRRDGRPHPMVAAMNALGYDGMTLGNHDFNYGLEFLETALSGARFPAVLANIRHADGAPFVPPSTILTRRMRDCSGQMHDMRIGLIGLAPPQTLKWDKCLLDGRLQAEDMLVAARREVAALRKAGADLVIVLSHSGLGPDEARPQMENAVVPLAQVPGVDAIVAGHTHEVFPAPRSGSPAWLDAARGTVHGTPVVQPGFDGSHLGVIDLDLAEINPGVWRVAAARAHVVPTARRDPANGHIVPAAPSSPAVLRSAAEDHAATLGYIRRQIGRTTIPLHSYFALLANSAAVQIVADAQRAHAAQALAGHPLAHLPLLSAAAPFKAGGRGGPQNYTDIPAGPLAIKNASDLYIYPNGVSVLKVNGAQVADWLERSASAFFRLEPGQDDQPLIDHDFAGYNFDVMDGLTYEIDVTVPARYSADGEAMFPTPGRILHLKHQGRPVAPDDQFLVATNSYRAAGGGLFPGVSDVETVLAEPVPVRDILIRHISARESLAPVPAPTWRFAPAGGIGAIAEIGPGALGHPDQMKALGLRHVGTSPTGFARFALTL